MWCLYQLSIKEISFHNSLAVTVYHQIYFNNKVRETDLTKIAFSILTSGPCEGK